MEVIVFEKESFYKLVAEVVKRLDADRQRQAGGKTSATDKEWLSLQEAKQLIPYKSKARWQMLRDRGEISFAQFGRKIVYERSSILAFLRKNKISQFK